jgi:hypothetical protein
MRPYFVLWDVASDVVRNVLVHNPEDGLVFSAKLLGNSLLVTAGSGKRAVEVLSLCLCLCLCLWCVGV